MANWGKTFTATIKDVLLLLYLKTSRLLIENFGE